MPRIRNIAAKRSTVFILLLSGYGSHRRSARLFSERKHAVLFWGFGRPRSRAGLFDQCSQYTALPEGFLYLLVKKQNKVDFGWRRSFDILYLPFRCCSFWSKNKIKWNLVKEVLWFLISTICFRSATFFSEPWAFFWTKDSPEKSTVSYCLTSDLICFPQHYLQIKERESTRTRIFFKI